MTYGRKKLGLPMLKPEQETAISNVAIGKDKITGSRCFLNRCEVFFFIKLNGNDITSKWIVDIPKICITPGQIPRPSFPTRATESDPHWGCLGLGTRL